MLPAPAMPAGLPQGGRPTLRGVLARRWEGVLAPTRPHLSAANRPRLTASRRALQAAATAALGRARARRAGRRPAGCAVQSAPGSLAARRERTPARLRPYRPHPPPPHPRRPQRLGAQVSELCLRSIRARPATTRQPPSSLAAPPHGTCRRLRMRCRCRSCSRSLQRRSGRWAARGGRSRRRLSSWRPRGGRALGRRAVCLSSSPRGKTATTRAPAPAAPTVVPVPARPQPAPAVRQARVPLPAVR